MHRVAWLVCWWLALFWLWLAFAGEWNRIEIVAAAFAATTATAIAEVVRRQRTVRFRLRRRWLREAYGVPLQILVDCATLLAALARRRAGAFRTHSTGPGGRSAEAAGRAAFLTVVAGYSPNAYVVDVSRTHNTVLVHDLVPFRQSEKPV